MTPLDQSSPATPADVAERPAGVRADHPQSRNIRPVRRPARVAWSFRSLFNTPEVTQLIRGMPTGGAYWRKALRYCSEGCLQSVVDEYLTVLP